MLNRYEYLSQRITEELEKKYEMALGLILDKDTDINETNLKRGYVAALGEMTVMVEEIKKKMKEIETNE